MDNQKVLKANGVVVERYRILGTDIFVHVAYEPLVKSKEHPFGDHSTITTIDGKWFGQISTTYLPETFKDLKVGSKERTDAVIEYYASEYQRAYAEIIEVFPYCANGTKYAGQIEVYKI